MEPSFQLWWAVEATDGYRRKGDESRAALAHSKTVFRARNSLASERQTWKSEAPQIGTSLAHITHIFEKLAPLNSIWYGIDPLSSMAITD